jgi:starvation-inducible DNA-binding protein
VNSTNRFPTTVAIQSDLRAPLVERLNELMATTIDLYTQVKQAHWNIKGPQFVSRHELFDDLADHLRGHADELAERVSTLGGYATGTARQVAANSILPEYDSSAVDGRAHIRCLVERYGTFAERIRHDINAVTEIGDPASEDMLIALLRETEKDLWFLESHINV